MKKLIILCPLGPFSKRDYDRFGIEVLKKNFSLKILNLTKWIYPKLLENESLNTYKFEECVNIANKNDFFTFVNASEVLFDGTPVEPAEVIVKKLVKTEDKLKKYFDDLDID